MALYVRVECSQCNNPLEAEINPYGVILITPCDCECDLNEEMEDLTFQHEKEIKKLKDEIEDLEQHIIEKDETISFLHNEIEELEERVKQPKRQIPK